MPFKKGGAGMAGFPPEDVRAVLHLTRDLWEEMRGGRLLLGGVGFVGRWLLESFLSANAEFALGASAVVLTRSPEKLLASAPHFGRSPAIKIFRWELAGGPLPAGPFSHVIHAATADGYPTPAAQAEAMIRGAARLTGFAAKRGAKALLLVSSGAVYDRMGRGPTPIPEADKGYMDPLSPARFYGESRRFMEALCCEEARGSDLRVKVARGFGFVGPGMQREGRFAIMDFIEAALAGGPVVIRNTGRARRSYLYASDMAAWFWTILFSGEAERPYNIGSEEGYTIAKIARLVAKSMGGEVPVVISGEPEPLGQRVNYVPDTSRARGELGLRMTVGLGEAVRKTLSFCSPKPKSDP